MPLVLSVELMGRVMGEEGLSRVLVPALGAIFSSGDDSLLSFTRSSPTAGVPQIPVMLSHCSVCLWLHQVERGMHI